MFPFQNLFNFNIQGANIAGAAEVEREREGKRGEGASQEWI